jgi:hypothetical protein
MDLVIGVLTLLLVLAFALLATYLALTWTVRRILRPIDQAAKARNAPFRFSIGDFLCLFWFVQLPLAFVFQLDTEETALFYWALTVTIWAVAPLVWFTCATALSKAGISTGKHRIIVLALVVPLVYYGLFPFIGLSWVGAVSLALNGPQPVLQNFAAVALWFGIAIGLVVSGFYSPWVVREVNRIQSDSTILPSGSI